MRSRKTSRAPGRLSARWRYYTAGLAYFSMDRFEEAIQSLEKIDAQSENQAIGTIMPTTMENCSYPLMGILDVMPISHKRIEPYLAKAHRPTEYSGLVFMGEFPFKNYADLERVHHGLRKARVPELPFGLDPKSKDRLNGPTIKALPSATGLKDTTSLRAILLRGRPGLNPATYHA